MGSRQLSDIEKKYIEEHYLDTDAQKIASQIKGVGEATVQEYIDELPPAPVEGESPEERKKRLQSTKISGSRLMGRDKERGITVMTPAAAELIDARKEIRTRDQTKNQREKNKRIIHKPFDDED
jgi:hypothetical protein